MDGDRVPSGWRRRAAAALIDGSLTIAVAALVLWPFGFDFEEYLDGEALLLTSRPIDITFLLMDAAVALVYYTPMMVAWEGRTLGKRALGIRVVRADRRRSTPAPFSSARCSCSACSSRWFP